MLQAGAYEPCDLGNAALVACLPLLCQGFKWLNRRTSDWYYFHSLGTSQRHLLSSTVRNSKPLNFQHQPLLQLLRRTILEHQKCHKQAFKLLSPTCSSSVQHVPVQSSTERMGIGWTSADTSRECCSFSFSFTQEIEYCFCYVHIETVFVPVHRLAVLTD